MNFLKKLNFTSGFRPLGRMRKICPGLMMIALLLVLPDRASCQPETAGETVEVEMLEFLGSFEDQDTGWVDPFELEAMEKDNATPEENSDEK